MDHNNKGDYMSMNQRNATVSTILSVIKAHGVSYTLNGETPVADVLTDKMKEEIRAKLFTMFRDGSVAYSEEFKTKASDDTELKKYISGLVNNWIRKAPEFNNGSKYEAKNPGSRQGSQDEQVREMKKLLSITTDAKAKASIQQAIDNRLAAIASEKKQVTINVDALPESLRHLVNG